MRRTARHFRTFTVLLSLLLCTAVAVLWARSYWDRDELLFPKSGVWGWVLLSENGTLALRNYGEVDPATGKASIATVVPPLVSVPHYVVILVCAAVPVALLAPWFGFGGAAQDNQRLCRMRRTLFIVAWTIASFFAWAAVVAVAGQALWIAMTERGLNLPDWLLKVFSFGFVFGGLCVVPGIVALLGMRGRLPGTRTEPRPKPRGFPVNS